MRSRLLSLGVCGLLVFNLVACGGGGHSGGSPSTGGALKAVVVAGRVVLPGGAAVPTGTTVGTAFGAFPVGTDGSFRAKVVDALPSLVTVAQGGTPLMMGMFGKDRPTVDATSEALALCLMRTGAGALPYDTLKVIVLKGGETDAVKSLAQTFESRGATHSTFSELAQASKSEIAAASTAFLSGGSRGINVVDADPKSGVTVLQTSLQKIALQNSYRRRALAFVDRVGYVPHDSPAGTPETPSPKDLGTVMVEPTLGVTSITGGFLDAAAGKVAYAPTTSEEVNLPNEPQDADTTRYKVTVVGLGGFPGGYDTLTGARKQATDDLQIESLFVDLVVPALMNLVLGGIGLSQASVNGSLDADDTFINYANYARSAITLAQSGIPTLVDDLHQGNLGKALGDTIDFAVNDSSFQGKITELLTTLGGDIVQKIGGDRVAFAAEVKNVFVLLAAGDFALAAGDFLAVTHDVALSEQASEFEVRTTASRVKLSPAKSETNPYTEVDLVAKAFDVGEDEQGIAYDWSVSGVGALRDGTQVAATIHERDGKLAFSPNVGQFGTATITVKAVKTNPDGTTQDLGTAKATVEVKDVQATLLPKRQSVKPGGTITFSAKVTNDLTGGPYLYNFYGSEAFGSVENAHKILSSPSATYHARSGEGKDTITVEVYRLVQGTPVKIASATGEARVEQEPTIIQGSLQFLLESYADGTTPYRSISAYVGFSPVQGATRYVLHGYGGNDTAYYGTSIERSADAPVVSPSVIGTPIPNAFGLSGGAGAGSADPDDSWYRARFGGFTWEIEVFK